MKILIVADVPNWAFYNNAKSIIKYLNDYDIELCCCSEIPGKNFNNFDHVHFMNWYDSIAYTNHVSGGVSSHNFEYHHKYLFLEKASQYKALVSTSKILYNLIKDKNKNVFCIQSGVDTDLFKFHELENHDKFIIGWVGQLNFKNVDIKGIKTILYPLIKRLNKYKNIEFKLHTASAYENRIDLKDMPNIYKNMDCIICTSLREGAPNPVFEAASVGRAIITTRVGSSSEMVKHETNGYIVDSYEKDDIESYEKTINKFEDYILKLYHDRDLLINMGRKSREIVEKNWTWEIKSQRYRDLFSLFE